MFTTGNMSAPVPRPKSSYDPNGFCDYCKRTGHTQAICYQLHGYPPGFERRKKGPNNTFQGRGRASNDRRSYPAAHNAISDGDLDYNRGVNPMVPRTQGHGRGSRYTEQSDYERGVRHNDHTDYHKGMTVLHEQYNQILHMLGQSNVQGGTEATTSSSGHSSTNLAQENYTSADPLQ
ncbi:hypothetical protein H5410_039570 [Solanum commersonii]|uniref:Uncharacterized protein n=1 Tax=Solanum commersonii TaxID=4109 RepID=A0A9J5XPM5_SOLCO|nr:hypothetical protein H5410_039570 [Solanum commersonii]